MHGEYAVRLVAMDAGNDSNAWPGSCTGQNADGYAQLSSIAESRHVEIVADIYTVRDFRGINRSHSLDHAKSDPTSIVIQLTIDQ
jgi:hypothetical protein